MRLKTWRANVLVLLGEVGTTSNSQTVYVWNNASIYPFSTIPQYVGKTGQSHGGSGIKHLENQQFHAVHSQQLYPQHI